MRSTNKVNNNPISPKRKGFTSPDDSFYTAYEYSYEHEAYDYSSSSDDDHVAPMMMKRNESAPFQRAMSWKPKDYAPGRITNRDRNAWVPQRAQSSKQSKHFSVPHHNYNTIEFTIDREYSYDYYFSDASSEEEDQVAPMIPEKKNPRNQTESFQRAISSKPKPSLQPADKSASKASQGIPTSTAAKVLLSDPLGPTQGPHPDSFDSFEAAVKAAEDKSRREKSEECNMSRKLHSLVDSCRSDMARAVSKEHSIRSRKTFHKTRRTESKSRLFDRTHSVQAVVKAEHNAINGIMELAAKQSLRGKIARLIFGWRFFLPENEQFRENIRQNTPGFKGRSVSMIKGEEYL